jgi:hypothetical protein
MGLPVDHLKHAMARDKWFRHHRTSEGDLAGLNYVEFLD